MTVYLGLIIVLAAGMFNVAFFINTVDFTNAYYFKSKQLDH